MTSSTPAAQVIDFRSDTVTKPSKEMLAAMLTAEVGDDVLIEDPTIIKLEEHVAKLCGTEAALFVCSGTMGNQLALRVHLSPLEELIIDARAHIYRNECGGVSFHSGASIMPITPANAKFITAAEVEQKIKTKNDWHAPLTKGVALENATHGIVIPIEEIEKIAKVAKANGLFMHLDGARLWNAMAATGLSLKDYVQHFDSASLCFSKGLGSPMGSVIVGTKQFIQKARHYRKVFGGGLRQAGIIAATMLYALEHNFEKLKTDHANAKLLEQGMRALGFDMDYPVETNMVYANSTKLGITFEELEKKLQKEGLVIRMSPNGYKSRIALHLDVSEAQVNLVLQRIKEVLG